MLLVFLVGEARAQPIRRTRSDVGGLFAAALTRSRSRRSRRAHFFTTDLWLVYLRPARVRARARSAWSELRASRSPIPRLRRARRGRRGLGVASKASGALLVVPPRGGARRPRLPAPTERAASRMAPASRGRCRRSSSRYVSFRLASPYSFRSSNWLDVTLDPRYRTRSSSSATSSRPRVLPADVPVARLAAPLRPVPESRRLAVGVAFGVCAARRSRAAASRLVAARAARPPTRRSSIRSATTRAFVRRDAHSFVAVVFLYISTRFQHMGRYLLPIVPLLAVAASFGLLWRSAPTPALLAASRRLVLVATAAYALAFH